MADENEFGDKAARAAGQAGDLAKAEFAAMKAQMKSRSLGDYLSFRALITPMAIQLIFWIGILVVLGAALKAMMEGEFGAGLLILVVGPLVWRIYCEIFIVIFKINDAVQTIAKK